MDPKRVNEFGTSQEMMDNPAAALDSDAAGENGTPAITSQPESNAEISPPKSEADKKTD